MTTRINPPSKMEPDRIGKGEIDTLEKLYALDEDDIIAGYMEGWDDPSIPIGKSAGYMHGWLNAQVDKSRMKPSEAMRRLAHEYVNRKKTA